MGGELLAEDCSADVLFLLTAVEHVAINFGKPNQEELEELTADEAERLADEGQFGKGSMEPRSAPPSSSRAPARAAPASSVPRQGRRDHGRSLRHAHHGLDIGIQRVGRCPASGIPMSYRFAFSLAALERQASGAAFPGLSPCWSNRLRPPNTTTDAGSAPT